MTDQLRPDVAAFLAALNAMPGPKMHELEAVQARAILTASRGLSDLPIGPIAVKRDLSIPGPAGPIPARLYDDRAARAPGPVMVFFHGGGFVLGDLDSHESYCAEAARVLDLPVIAIDYRLAPEHPFPAAPDDCEAAARWIAAGPAELGRGVSALVLSGDSAGGNLAIVTTLALRDSPAAAPVIVQYPIYPVTTDRADLRSLAEHGEGKLLTADSIAWSAAAYRADAADIRANPLAADHRGTPPTLIVTAGADPIRDHGRLYAAALAEAGVAVTFREARGNIHGFIGLRKAIPSAAGDVAALFALLKPMIVEAEAARVMAQAAGGA